MSQESDNIPQKIEMIINVPCNACGGEMTYSAEKQSLLCQHCGNTRDLPKESDMIIEQSLSEGLSLNNQATGLDANVKAFHCKNCGSETTLPPDQVNISCPFCGSPNVNEEAQEQRVIRPAGLVPFKVDKKKAQDQFNEWIGAGWFSPNNLKKMAQLNLIKGVYIPFWTYDAETSSAWTAMAGYYYYTTESYTDSQGKTQTRQVRHTRWVPASGYYEHSFDDVLVVASHGVTQSAVTDIYPYALNEAVNYDARYLLGFQTELYQKDVQEGWSAAEDMMDDYIRQECARRVPGDTHMNLNVRTQKTNLTFKHLLLPLWIAAYQYNGKTYQFLVNGQTGKISGQRPLSFWKVTFAVLIVLAIVAAGIFLYTKYK